MNASKASQNQHKKLKSSPCPQSFSYSFILYLSEWQHQARNLEVILDSSFLLNSHKKVSLLNISEIQPPLSIPPATPLIVTLSSATLLVKVFPSNPFSARDILTNRNYITQLHDEKALKPFHHSQDKVQT